ncbi:hypothetical protein EDB80DRAFT_690749 [Ilyonectria destructans]|nr:hypothetical protein EDB80DRAFT_690749 [Ilyonectria destructans]
MALFASPQTFAAGVLGTVASTCFGVTSVSISSLTTSTLLLQPQITSAGPSEHLDSFTTSWYLARQWAQFEAYAHNVATLGMITGASTFIYAALYYPERAALQSNLFWAGAACNLLTIPYTILFMLQKNNELDGRAKTGKKQNFGDRETTQLMQSVAWLGKLRGSLPLVGVIMGFLALSI